MTIPTATLGEVALKLQDGPFGSNLKSAHYVECGVRVVRLQNIGAGHFVDSDKAYIATDHFETLRKHECLAGDILLATLGDPILRAARLPETVPVALNKADCLQLRPDPTRVDASYLIHFLNSAPAQTRARAMAHGQTRPRVNLGQLRELPIPVPPLEEQRRIAAILDAADTLGAKRRRALDKLDILPPALFIKMFGHPLRDGTRWPTAAIARLGEVVTGQTPPGSKDGMYGNAVPFVTPGDLESEAPPQRWLSELGAKHVRIVPPGSTMVCCIGTIGKVGQTVVDTGFNQQINAVDWDRELVAPAFGTTSLRLMKADLARRGSSTTLPLLNKSSFKAVEIPVPPVDKQREFEYIVIEAAIRRRVYEKALERHRLLLDSLQQRAFAGEL